MISSITSGPALFEERALNAEARGHWGAAASHWSKASEQAPDAIRKRVFGDNAERCRRRAERQAIPAPFTKCVRIDAGDGSERECTIGRAEEKIADHYEPCGIVLDQFRRGERIRTVFARYELRK